MPKQVTEAFVRLALPLLKVVFDDDGGRRSPAVACWASDHWVASSNPLRGKFRLEFRLIIPGVCLAQFSLNNVHKRGLKHHHFISTTTTRKSAFEKLRSHLAQRSKKGITKYKSYAGKQKSNKKGIKNNCLKEQPDDRCVI